MDRKLRAISWRRATLDAEEAHWLREAEALQIWRPLGMVSAIDYMERVMGYAPRTAQERLRVARALGDLPELTETLATGRLPYSAVRELTRVATPGTEVDWRDAALGKNLRQIEELVADHRPGDRPDDAPSPEARTRVVRLELSASTFALLRQARQLLDDEHGCHLSDDELVAALCDSVLDGAPDAEPSGRAKFQIAVTICERCRQGWQDGAGARVAIDAAAVDRALCDAQHIGSLEADTPARAVQDVAPSVARLVWRRDHGRCRVPGCRSARGLEIHHIVHREDGGSHEASNLLLVCSACHLAHHEGRLTISGTADHLEVRRPDAPFTATVTAHAHEISTRSAKGESLTAVYAQADVIGSADATSTRPADADAIAIAAATPHAGAIAVAKPYAHVGAIAVAKPHAHAGSTSTRRAYMDAISTRRAHMDATTAPQAPATDAHVIEPARASAPMREPTRLELAVLRTQAKQALTSLGWKPAIAAAAVAAAPVVPGNELSLERLICAALRQCPRPRT